MRLSVVISKLEVVFGGRLQSGLVALFTVCVTGCQPPLPSKPVLSRSDLFRLHCSSCHGDGSGNGHIAGTLPVRPRNLRHPEWQASVTDEHILKVIRQGGAVVKLSDKMPGFADKLSEAEMQSLVQYLRALR